MPSRPRATRDVDALDSLHAIADSLLERPDPALDDALNAAVACFIRHGLARTSMRDIAAELGVSKATVYRQVGSLDDVVRTLLARETHRLVDIAAAAAQTTTGSDAVLAVIVAAGQHIAGHPLLGKVLTDEPSLAAELLTHIPAIGAPIVEVLTAVIDQLRPEPGAGSPAPVVAQVACRLVLADLVLPSPDLSAMLRDALGPHLRS